jgi:hypothetical protein
MTSIPEITRLQAAIQNWQDGYGQAGGRADAARRLDEAHKLLTEVANLLTGIRRTMLGGGNRAS